MTLMARRYFSQSQRMGAVTGIDGNISLEGLSQGSYLVHLRQTGKGGLSQTQRFVKQ